MTSELFQNRWSLLHKNIYFSLYCVYNDLVHFAQRQIASQIAFMTAYLSFYDILSFWFERNNLLIIKQEKPNIVVWYLFI